MSNDREDVLIRIASWPKDIEPLRQVRTVVFIDEQNVTEDEEWDGQDDQCTHVLAELEDGTPIGTGRLLPDGKIGRMAVLKEYRGRDIGGRLLQRLVELAQEQGHREVKLAAQTHAIPFYERHGFTAFGEEFPDAGIPHRWMKAALARDDGEED
ncbi:MAG: GNAT family N-acetyltransferase [Gammaproteobacteria bacterium]|nr:GNAT family N-acetyltransferase [Gammaproteobacteria bacterium]